MFRNVNGCGISSAPSGDAHLFAHCGTRVFFWEGWGQWHSHWQDPGSAPCSAFRPSAPEKCPFWLAAVTSGCKRGQVEHRRTWGEEEVVMGGVGGGVSGPASVSGWRRPRLCEAGRWRSEGRRCRSRRCPTRSCWLRPAGTDASGKWIANKKSDSHQISFPYLSAFVDGVGADASVHFDVERGELTPQPVHLGTRSGGEQVEAELKSGSLAKQRESGSLQEREKSLSLGLEAARLWGKGALRVTLIFI